jgi:hypothetical protein
VKFPWISLVAGGRKLPWVRCTFRRPALVAPPPDLLLIMDTGADGVLLPEAFAGPLGFDPAKDLEPMVSNGLGGQTTVLKPRGNVDVEICIGGFWFSLPTLAFSQKCPPLLGRDVVFANFDLRMCDGETDLRPRKK